MNSIAWDAAIRYAHLVALAESVAPQADYSSELVEQIRAAGYELLQPIFGNELATDLDPHLGEIVTFGFIARSPGNEIVAAIRGTDTIWEWIHDGCFLMVPAASPRSHGLTEDGFTAVFRSLRAARDNTAPCIRDVIKGYLDTGAGSTVTICGHSLGGALATLLSLDVALNTSCRSPVTYTFASPRVGDHIFASLYNAAAPRTYRIVNRHDLVPQLPPILPLPYEHVNTLYEVVPPAESIDPSIPCMHHLTTYVWLMGRAAGVNVGTLDSDCQYTAAPQPTRVTATKSN